MGFFNASNAAFKSNTATRAIVCVLLLNSTSVMNKGWLYSTSVTNKGWLYSTSVMNKGWLYSTSIMNKGWLDVVWS